MNELTSTSIDTKPQPKQLEKEKKTMTLHFFERRAKRRISRFLKQTANKDHSPTTRILLGRPGNTTEYVTLRKSTRVYDEKKVPMFDVVQVSFKDKGRGKFGRLMKAIDELNPCQGIRIESITNPILVGWLERRKEQGWQLEPNSDRVQPTYYRLNTPTPQQN